MGGRRLRGFTLIELIMVIVMLGVLAVFAAPRIFNTGDFNARGFRDETLGLLRIAQKTAIAQRRAVCVTNGVNGLALTMDISTPPDGICEAAPAGAVPLANTPRGGAGMGVVAFQFLPLGSTNQASDVVILIPDAAFITVDFQTGYVR